MLSVFKKKYLLPVLAASFLFVGVGFSLREDYFEVAKQIEIFTQLYKAVNANYVDETNPAELMNIAIKSMLADLDPYTNYFNEQDVVKYKINNTGEYADIGALVARKDDRLIIKEPYKNMPADKAGLKAGDAIIQIGDVDLRDFKDDAAQLLKGGKGTKISIKYIRQGKTLSGQIELGEAKVKAVPFFGKIDEKTGYIVLTQFTNSAALEVREALEQLKNEGIERLVLDLRDNPGGLLNEAVSICNFFVPKDEIIVTTKSRIEKHNNTHKTMREPIDTQIPLAIIVNGKSASASEIVSGALQDLDRAVILGARSFGKGLVQRPVDLTYGTQLKVTISRYYTPSGRCIQALDYTHKDKDGKAIRTTAEQYNAFKTKNGRTVYDGGGILPDIVLAETKLSPMTEKLLANDGIFDFATEYYYKKPNLGNQIPNITDADFVAFKAFLKSVKFNFDSESEAALKNAWKAAQKEKVDTGIQTEYQQLLAALERTQEAQLTLNQKEIKNLLQDELIKRYQYKEGLYQYYLKNNPEIKRAQAVLANSTEYKQILHKQ